MVKKTYEEVKKAFEDRGYILVSEEYVNAFSPLQYICPKHKPDLIRKIKWNSFQQGHGCRECGYEKVSKNLAYNKRTPYEEVVKLFENEGLELLSTEEEYYKSSNPELKFICSCSPNEIQTKRWTAFLNISHCTKCFNIKEKRERRRKDFGELKKLCEEKGYIVDDSEIANYKNCLSRIKYICPFHGEKYTSLSHLKEGKGCKECACKENGERLQLPISEIVNRLAKEELVLVSDYIGINRTYTFSCVKHPQIKFEAKMETALYSGLKCPICKESKGEKKIRIWLEDNNILYEPQKKYEDLYRFTSQNKLSYDFFLPEFNILI